MVRRILINGCLDIELLWSALSGFYKGCLHSAKLFYKEQFNLLGDTYYNDLIFHYEGKDGDYEELEFKTNKLLKEWFSNLDYKLSSDECSQNKIMFDSLFNMFCNKDFQDLISDSEDIQKEFYESVKQLKYDTRNVNTSKTDNLQKEIKQGLDLLSLEMYKFLVNFRAGLAEMVKDGLKFQKDLKKIGCTDGITLSL